VRDILIYKAIALNPNFTFFEALMSLISIIFRLCEHVSPGVARDEASYSFQLSAGVFQSRLIAYWWE